MGHRLEIATDAGSAEAYLTGDEAGRGPGVLFYVDALGLRPRTEEMADRIASWGYVVLVPHVFHRDGDAAQLAPQGDMHDEEQRQQFLGEAMGRLERLTPELSDPDARAWVATLQEYAPGPVGVTGYCMGARLATRTAGLLPEDVAAVGGFHGGGLVTDDASSPHRMVPTARAEFCYGHADQDASMPPEAVATLGETLESAGLVHRNEVYEGAGHGYTMSDLPVYHEAATERHFAALQDLFGRTLATA